MTVRGALSWRVLGVFGDQVSTTSLVFPGSDLSSRPGPLTSVLPAPQERRLDPDLIPHVPTPSWLTPPRPSRSFYFYSRKARSFYCHLSFTLSSEVFPLFSTFNED